MGRLLDEDAVIKVLERWQKAFRENSHYVSASDLSLVVKDVRELPHAQPEPHWIPVSERLPEESEYCIITANDGVGYRTTFAKFQKKAKSWDLTGARSYWKVIAWTPLPKPFEGGTA